MGGAKIVRFDTAAKKTALLDAATLADRDLDRRISDGAAMIRSALRDHDRATAEQRRCQKSAVLSAWRVGRLLIEKKSRLRHGEFGPWLAAIGISSSSAADYMTLGREISDVGNLKSSIAQTLKALAPPPAAPRPAAVQPAEKMSARQPPAAPRDRIGELEARILVLEDELVQERELTAELRSRIELFEAAAAQK